MMLGMLTKVAEDLVGGDCRPDVQTYQGLDVSFWSGPGPGSLLNQARVEAEYRQLSSP
jgi:hypothetical protein